MQKEKPAEDCSEEIEQIEKKAKVYLCKQNSIPETYSPGNFFEFMYHLIQMKNRYWIYIFCTPSMI